MNFLETPRLRLIPLTLRQMQLLLDDYQGLEAALGLPQSNQKLVQRLRAVISHDISFVREDPDSHLWYTYWLMVAKENERIAGGLGFKGPADERQEVEIGYGTDEAYRNRGYMTEAVSALVRWALKQPGVSSVRAETANTNVSSMRVLRKVGFVPYRATDRFLYWRLSRQSGLAEEAGSQGTAHQGEPGGAAEFTLYDLTVVVEAIHGTCTCDMKVGDCFHVRRSSSLSLPDGGHFCLYALQSVLPLLPARQRRNHPADWIESDSRVACPDPACGLIMRIDRVGEQILSHDEVSAVPQT